MYGSDSAKIYHAQHTARGKDYGTEAKVVADQIHLRMPHAASVLDVACGTGGHLKPFTELIGYVEGTDISEPMLEIARNEVPDVVLHHGDMRDLDLDRTFDALTCLFASIAYVDSLQQLQDTIARFARHVSPGGVVAVEPWWFPETYLDRYVSSDIVTYENMTIVRAAHTVRDGDASRMEVHYVVASPDGGIRHLTEVHRAMLFTRDQYEQAFRLAGLTPEYVPEIQSGRGLFVGVRDRAAETQTGL